MVGGWENGWWGGVGDLTLNGNPTPAEKGAVIMKISHHWLEKPPYATEIAGIMRRQIQRERINGKPIRPHLPTDEKVQPLVAQIALIPKIVGFRPKAILQPVVGDLQREFPIMGGFSVQSL